MSVSVFSAAKRLGEQSGWTLTNLQMQKMSYLAHMYHMGQGHGPLIDGQFEAWDLGPVHPELYQLLKQFRADPVERRAFRPYFAVPDGHSGARYLDAAVKELPRNRLVTITHWKHGAWRKNYQFGANCEISNSDIMDEFRKRKDARKK